MFPASRKASGTSQVLKNVCWNTGGPRDFHTKWSQAEKDKYRDNTYMWNLKKKIRWTYRIETDKQIKQVYGYQRERGWRRDKLGVWD